MTENGKSVERVTFSRGYDVCMMAIDGTWRRNCQLSAISDDDAVLNVAGSIQGLNLKEFFLLLSSTGGPILTFGLTRLWRTCLTTCALGRRPVQIRARRICRTVR
jgi:hypothetical protein